MSYAIFRSQGIKTLHELSQKGGTMKEQKKNTSLTLISKSKTVKIILK